MGRGQKWEWPALARERPPDISVMGGENGGVVLEIEGG